MQKTPPIIDGKTVDKHQDLDNKANLLELGLDPDTDLKIADSYDHYQHCKDAVIEYGSTLHKAIEQVESTIKRLLAKGKKVDLLIMRAPENHRSKIQMPKMRLCNRFTNQKREFIY